LNQSFAIALPGSAPLDTTNEELATKSDFVPFLSLLAGQSKAVLQNEPRGARPGIYLFKGTTLLEKVLVIPTKIASRPRASFNPKNPELGRKVECHDPNHEDWKYVKKQRGSKNENVKKAATIGLESLLWLPEQNSFAIFGFTNSKQKAHDAYAAARAKGVAIIMGGKLNTSTDGSFSWYTPTIEEVSRLPELPKMPTPDALQEAVTQFLAYKGEAPAAAEADER
jgi:hypothetical protein